MAVTIFAPDLLLSFHNFATYLAGANFVQIHFSSSAPTVDLTTGQNPGVVMTEVSWDPVYIAENLWKQKEHTSKNPQLRLRTCISPS